MTEYFVDEETGESLDLYHFTLRGCSPVSSPLIPVNNAETGEPEDDDNEVSRRRIPFQIPRALQKEVSSTETKLKDCDERMKRKPVPKGEPFGQTNPVMLFVPAIFYFRWMVVVVVCFEVVLHIWAHHKNKRLKNSTVYFRSPLHSITSEFCALCTSETCMDRVGKMQEIRAHKFLRQCNYMKRVVT